MPTPSIPSNSQSFLENTKSTTSKKLEALIEKLERSPENVALDEALEAISDAYDFVPVAFSNGPLKNAAGEKVRSCMLYAFGRLHNLSAEKTLACFGEHYREVLADPEGTSHMTIRIFMKSGWAGVSHESMPLRARPL